MPTVDEPPLDHGRVVMDAAALVALLTVEAGAGRWVADQIGSRTMVGPHLLVFEAANVLRRLEAIGRIDATAAALAHQDLLDASIWLVGYAPLADRARELRPNLTSYDASYVALAEALEAPLITLDARIARAPGIRCEVRLPPSITPRVRGRNAARGA